MVIAEMSTSRVLVSEEGDCASMTKAESVGEVRKSTFICFTLSRVINLFISSRFERDKSVLSVKIMRSGIEISFPLWES